MTFHQNSEDKPVSYWNTLPSYLNNAYKTLQRFGCSNELLWQIIKLTQRIQNMSLNHSHLLKDKTANTFTSFYTVFIFVEVKNAQKT